MAWQSFNDVYIPKSGGGDIEGSLSVSGNLVVNDGSGKGTTYDVASEISDLKSAWDSVSQRVSNRLKFTWKSQQENGVQTGLYLTIDDKVTMLVAALPET